MKGRIFNMQNAEIKLNSRNCFSCLSAREIDKKYNSCLCAWKEYETGDIYKIDKPHLPCPNHSSLNQEESRYGLGFLRRESFDVCYDCCRIVGEDKLITYQLNEQENIKLCEYCKGVRES